MTARAGGGAEGSTSALAAAAPRDGRDLQVMVAVPTYRRPGQLRRLLPTLIEQCDALGAGVVVIDNDPLAGAAATVHSVGSPTVSYVHEPAPGLSAVRNRALTVAADADVLVFIDDDCVPGRGWLAALVQRWTEWGCTAVTGPVRWELEVESAWVRASGAFDRVRRPTGTVVRGAATNNLLLDVTETAALGLRFDERFGLSGGEDTMLTHHLVALGGTIRWAGEAEIVEPVPASRTTRRWVLRRTFRAGTTWSRMRLILAGSGHRRRHERFGLVVRGVRRILVGGVRLAFGTARRDLRDRAGGTCLAMSGLGMILGTFGHLHLEYGRRDPAPDGGAGPAGHRPSTPPRSRRDRVRATMAKWRR